MSERGHCLCGAVSYTVPDVDPHFHVCHCNACRRWSGGPAFSAKVSGLKIDDETHLVRFASSDWAERAFCARCGSHLFYQLKDKGDMYLWIGTLEDSSQFEIGGEIFIDEKPAGYEFAGDHDRLTGAQVFAAMQAEDA